MSLLVTPVLSKTAVACTDIQMTGVLEFKE